MLMASWLENIITLVVSGGLLGALFNWMSQRRHYRQTLETKMVERITALTERYHVHVWRSSQDLGFQLEGSLQDRQARELCFLSLIEYLHQVDRLRQERPEPLLLDIQEAFRYLHEMTKVADGLPFDVYQISWLLDRYRGDGERPLQPHRFIDQVRENTDLHSIFEAFGAWCDACNCSPDTEDRCPRHRVALACLTICGILAAQNHALQTHWRDEGYRRRLGRRLRHLGRRIGWLH